MESGSTMTESKDDDATKPNRFPKDGVPIPESILTAVQELDNDNKEMSIKYQMADEALRRAQQMTEVTKQNIRTDQVSNLKVIISLLKTELKNMGIEVSDKDNIEYNRYTWKILLNQERK